MTTLAALKAPPPPSLFSCPTSLLVVRPNLIASFVSRPCPPSSSWITILISSSPFVADTLPSYYRRIGCLAQPNLGVACSCALPTSLSLWPTSVPGAASQEWCLEYGAVSRPAAMEGMSAAGVLAACGGGKETADQGGGAAEGGRGRARGSREGARGGGGWWPRDEVQLQQEGAGDRGHGGGEEAAEGIMDTIGPEDVGLRDEVRFFHRMNTRGRQNPPIITSKTILQCNSFTIAVFFLPLGSVMPLHDHPGMTVFSKVLIGSARLEAYDCVRPRVLPTWGSRMLAEKVRDHDVTAASGAWVLFPDGGGNLHRFMAAEEEHCAILDVLTPPYAPEEQRRCAY